MKIVGANSNFADFQQTDNIVFHRNHMFLIVRLTCNDQKFAIRYHTPIQFVNAGNNKYVRNSRLVF
jgi:hypothetical protein